MKKEHSVEDVYNDFWKDIVEENGVVDMEQVKKELADYHFMLEEVPKVYGELTFGRISKPNTYAFEVIREANSAREDHEKDIILDDITMLANEVETKDELMKELEEYFTED